MNRSLISRGCIAAALFGGAAEASVQLDIPPRRQWDNFNGYCGECSIQSIGLFFGMYVSQYRVREIIDPTQQQDVWVPDNSDPVFEALRLDFEAWDSNAPTPQYEDYLVWAKSHLAQGHPVIIDVFVQGGTDPAYDHIMPATGFTSVDTTNYHAADTLTFNDNYWPTPYTRTFVSLPDTRLMNGNGAIYEYCIPRTRDHGAAVTGIRDNSGTVLPVSLTLDRWNEPNVSLGATPVQMNAMVTARSLTNGCTYALLRYDGYANVPTSNYLFSAFNTSTVFTATNVMHTFADAFMSDGTVIYRCVPFVLPEPSAVAITASATNFQMQIAATPGSRFAVDWLGDLMNGNWSNLVTNAVSPGPTVTISDPGSQSQSARFYRFRTLWP